LYLSVWCYHWCRCFLFVCVRCILLVCVRCILLVCVRFILFVCVIFIVFVCVRCIVFVCVRCILFVCVRCIVFVCGMLPLVQMPCSIYRLLTQPLSLPLPSFTRILWSAVVIGLTHLLSTIPLANWIFFCFSLP
jgi:hypothetical protein